MKARILLGVLVAMLGACSTPKDNIHAMRVSIPDQKMILYRYNQEIARYDVSTSKFCIGDNPGSRGTPLGRLEVKQKIGAGLPIGMKLKSRRPTGEIVPINSPGRDPIVTRILWLRGLEPQNRNAYKRTIYIHGTAEEWRIGTPASYGCVRMRSRDIVRLFDTIGVGAQVNITRDHLPPAPGAVAQLQAPSPTPTPSPKPTM